MPLYLGLAASAQGLSAIVIEIEGAVRRVVFDRSFHFDRDLPDYNHLLSASPLMWADALDHILGRLAAAAEIEVERLNAISGAAHDVEGALLHQHLPDATALEPSLALAAQLETASPVAKAFDSLASYIETVIGGADARLSAYWRKRFALPPATIVPWTNAAAAGAIGTGIIREGVLAVSFGTNDTVIACPTDPAAGASVITFRNGALARELIRAEHHLDWNDVARILDESPANDGCVMLPWAEPEITPPIAHAALRRFGFDRHDADRNVRGLIEGQLMAMANHAARLGGSPVDKVIATGGAAANRAILQVTANVFGAEVHRLDTGNYVALGAALRAYHADRLAAGVPVSWKTVVSGFTDPKPGHRVSPNPRHVATYAELRTHYALLEQLHKDRAPIC
jgi:sugar (pentulose or hexulose) kinase